jgi:heparin binding hemagglutinin HbhA
MTTQTEDVRKTQSEDIRKAVQTAIEQVRTPLLAALGAGNLASQAVVDAVNKAKARMTESSETARKNIEELPNEVESLRGKLDPTELRKSLDEYTESALKFYNKLAEAGEQTWERFSAQPQVKKSIEQLEDAIQNVQDRLEGVTSDARDRVDDVLGKVTKRTRETGEKAADTVKGVTGSVADKVEEAGEEAAAETRDATRKAATKTTPRTANTTRRTTTASTPSTKKPNNGTTKPTGK